MIDLARRVAVQELVAHYGGLLDREDYQGWLDLFDAAASYRIAPRENIDQNLPASLMLCETKKALTDRLVAMPTRLAHRDFQSQNLMVTPRGLVVVDFQDAFMAPFVYDLVALLRDSYVRLDASELAALLAPYSAATREAFGVQTIQRKLKDAGRFVTLANKGKPEYLPFFGDTIGYVVEALVTTGLYPELLALLVELLPEARQALGP